jgi:hypothetical protein
MRVLSGKVVLASDSRRGDRAKELYLGPLLWAGPACGSTVKQAWQILAVWWCRMTADMKVWRFGATADPHWQC